MKKQTLFFVLIAQFVFTPGSYAQDKLQAKTGSWGDQGNGTYINPVLNADYSDPDVIRVKEDYYLVCSEFHFMGIPVLHSRDLVNWTIIARVYDEFKFDPKFDSNERYAGGSWAPAIRFHNNQFWLYFCTPDEGLFMTTADHAEGPWAPVTQVVDMAGWEDPCPFWDEDGKAYLSIPEGGVSRGWQTILRSKNTLTQKVMGYEGMATACLIGSDMQNGQKAGLCVMGRQYNLIGLAKTDGKLAMFVSMNGKVTTQAIPSSKVYLRVRISVEQRADQFYYSTDNKTFYPLGDTFEANNGFWKGPKIGLFSYNEKEAGGKALFDWYRYLYDGPKP